ncbi:hypothetical protein BN14_02788 [Rhizoctonia solani AG-1 IB]|uniref:Uncharacterized protein n=1 Tax=Thanatephorus cucumeris (strain AG1-IB / isolate 7/3/14) TaxID=1108050 RepID=M5BQQ3_THACB|nr:hypothetical protein BN14_02788 [Rhizoctonia solani AG-1 IB]
MVVINDKLPPPPPYHVGPRYPGPQANAGQVQLGPPPFQSRRACHSLIELPQHVLLHIVYATCPDDIPAERLRRRLYWVAMYLRLTSRALYIASMHLLRSTYLPLYTNLVKPPYTSDPFPLNAPSFSYYTPTPTATTSSPLATTTDPFSTPSLQSIQRETAILDRFLVLKICDDVRTDETELHLGSEDSFADIFDLMQPRSRVEDLVRVFGIQTGVIADTIEPAYSPVSTRRARSKKLGFETLSVNFSPRKISLVQTDQNRRKHTLVEVQRVKTETLEVSAKRLIRALIANGIVPDPSAARPSPSLNVSASVAGPSRAR